MVSYCYYFIIIIVNFLSGIQLNHPDLQDNIVSAMTIGIIVVAMAMLQFTSLLKLLPLLQCTYHTW